MLDFMDEAAPARLKAMLREGRADVVLSDMAAQGTGHARTDHLRIMGLAEAAAEFASRGAQPRTAPSCARCSRAAPSAQLLDRLKRAFATVKHVKPPASRAELAELYVVAPGFSPAGDRATEAVCDGMPYMGVSAPSPDSRRGAKKTPWNDS